MLWYILVIPRRKLKWKECVFKVGMNSIVRSWRGAYVNIGENERGGAGLCKEMPISVVR